MTEYAEDGRPLLTYPGNAGPLRYLTQQVVPGGIVVNVLPGTYDDYIFVRTNERVLVRAHPDHVGSLPTLSRPDFATTLAHLSKLSGQSEGSGELVIERLHLDGSKGDGIGCTGGRRIAAQACVIEHCRNGVLTSDIPLLDVDIRDCEFRYNGNGGNTTHNVYAHGRSLRFEGNYSHSSRGGHTLKTICRLNVIRGNRLETTDDPESTPSNLGPWSTTLLDLVAASRSVVSGNEFVRQAWRGNKQVISFRARQSMNGADLRWSGDAPMAHPLPGLPAYERFGVYVLGDDGWPLRAAGGDKPVYVKDVLVGYISYDPRYADAAYWARVAAGGMTDAQNPHLFVHYVFDNVFTNSGSTPIGVALFNEGTAPVESNEPRGSTPGGKQDQYLMPLPQGWTERALVMAARNAYLGDACVRLQGRRASIWSPGRDPDVSRVTLIGQDDDSDSSLARIIDLGSPDTLPAWWVYDL